MVGKILNAVIALVNLTQLALNPMVRPKSLARSLDASRRVVASGLAEEALNASMT